MLIRITHPLISCICVTAYRPEFLLKAIICFDSQKYPNKELVISYPKDDQETRNLVTHVIESSDLEILVIERDCNVTLGMARNEAVAKSNGNYICTWDDDDWYSERRLHDQYNNMLTVKQKREASILTHVILYNNLTDRAYISYPYKFAGTLLCKKEIVLQHPYEIAGITEDTSLVTYLEKSKYLHTMNRPDLYIYKYHGGNTLEKQYYLFFLGSAQPLDQTNTNWVSNKINIHINLL